MDETTRTTLNHYIDSFKQRVLDGKSDLSFDINVCEKMYDLAVRFAYNDAKRALKGITKTSKRQEEKDNALMALKNKIKGYFESQEASFNHKDYCLAFINEFHDYKMTFGAAQKIVNLTFKYLYCFTQFKNQYYDKFSPCQMVLDSFILSWFKRNVDKKKIVGIKHDETWSGLNDYSRYSNIQLLIERYVHGKDLGLSVLEYEFILWPNTLLYESAISWLSTISEINKSDAYNQFPISRLNDLINRIGRECQLFNSDINPEELF